MKHKPPDEFGTSSLPGLQPGDDALDRAMCEWREDCGRSRRPWIRPQFLITMLIVALAAIPALAATVYPRLETIAKAFPFIAIGLGAASVYLVRRQMKDEFTLAMTMGQSEHARLRTQDLWLAGYQGRHVFVGLLMESLRQRGRHSAAVFIVCIGVLNVVAYVWLARRPVVWMIVFLGCLGYFTAAWLRCHLAVRVMNTFGIMRTGLLDYWHREAERADVKTQAASFIRQMGLALQILAPLIFFMPLIVTQIIFMAACVLSDLGPPRYSRFFVAEIVAAILLVIYGLLLDARRRALRNAAEDVCETLAKADVLWDRYVRRTILGDSAAP